MSGPHASWNVGFVEWVYFGFNYILFLQSLIIWNNGLFFEFHDHLERIWQKTTGDEHQALKGLIKAAGV